MPWFSCRMLRLSSIAQNVVQNQSQSQKVSLQVPLRHKGAIGVKEDCLPFNDVKPVDTSKIKRKPINGSTDGCVGLFN